MPKKMANWQIDHFRGVIVYPKIELFDYQIEAVKNLSNGKILRGDVGTGKSRTAIAFYYFMVADGRIPVNGHGITRPMKNPIDLYIITTAAKSFN